MKTLNAILTPSSSINVIYSEQNPVPIRSPRFLIEVNGCIYNTNCEGAKFILGGEATVENFNTPQVSH